MQAFSKHSTHTLHRSKTAPSLLLPARGKGIGRGAPRAISGSFYEHVFPVCTSPCPQLCSPRRETSLSSVGAPGGAKGAVPGSQVGGGSRETLVFARRLWVESKGMEEKGRVTWVKPSLRTRHIICIAPMQSPQRGNRNQGSKMKPNLTKTTG